MNFITVYFCITLVKWEPTQYACLNFSLNIDLRKSTSCKCKYLDDVLAILIFQCKSYISIFFINQFPLTLEFCQLYIREKPHLRQTVTYING